MSEGASRLGRFRASWMVEVRAIRSRSCSFVTRGIASPLYRLLLSGFGLRFLEMSVSSHLVSQTSIVNYITTRVVNLRERYLYQVPRKYRPEDGSPLSVNLNSG